MGGATVHMQPVDRIGGDVFKVGTPLDNQVAVWTGDGTIEGDDNFTWDGSQVRLTSTGELHFASLFHGGDIRFSAEDAGGVEVDFFVLDPDLPRIRAEMPIYIEEQAANNGSFLTYGQFWVRDDIPNVPMFTNNFGTDVLLAGISAAGGASNQIAHFTNPESIEGDANLTYDSTAEQMMIQTVLNSINNIGLLMIDSDSVLNPDGWQITPGQAGLHDGTLIISDEPSDALNNRAMTILPGAATVFGYGASVANNVAFASETAGALAFFKPIDNTGREETIISGVGEVGGTGHEGLVSIEVYAYGDGGLAFTRQAQFVQDADGTIHMDLYGTIDMGKFGDAALTAGDNASLGWDSVNGLIMTGQGTTNDFVIYNDGLREIVTIPSSSGKVRIHYRFGATRYMEMEQNNTNFIMTGVNNVNDFRLVGIGGEFNVDNDTTIQGDLVVEGIRPSGTVEWDKGADIASASTLVLGSDGNSFDVTGTTDINAISAKPIGTVIILTFDGVVDVNHDATALDMSGDVTMVTEPDDTLGLICYDGTNWRELFRTDGQNVRSSGNIADQAIVRGNGGAKRIQDTGNSVGDNDEMILVGDLITTARTKNTTRVTTTYTILVTDEVIFANTDSGAFTATLPPGAQGRTFKVINSGSSGNALTLAPDGAEHLIGVNSNFVLNDGETLDLTYDATDGWY